MKRAWMRCALLGALGVSSAARVGAADDGARNADVLAELERMRTKIESMELLRDKDRERIDRLEDRLSTYEEGGAPDEVVRRRSEVRTDAEFGDAWGAAGVPAAGGLGQGNVYNPEITVFADGGGAVSTNSDNKALNRFNLRETELDFRAALGPTVDGVVILAFAEEVEQEDDGHIDVDQIVEIEEVYLNFHTLPYDLQVKAGRFRTAVGSNNRLHTHDLPQVTRPLAVEAFLGPEGLISDGVSVNWLVPNPWDSFIELTAEVFNSDGGPESPILGGPNADNPAVLTHVKIFEDLGETSSVELGGTYMYAHTGDEGSQNSQVIGLDAMFQWLDPRQPDSRSVLVQGEAFWADNDVLDGLDSHENSSFGTYAFAQLQFDRNWYAGVRGDYTEFPNSELFGPTDRVWAVSPYVSWYYNEFLRVRFEWQHRDFVDRQLFGEDDEDVFFLQFTYVIGAHPPHPYWVNR